MKLRYLLVLAAIPCLGACSDDDNGDDNDNGNGNGGGTRNTPFAFCGPATTCPPNTSGADLTTPVSFRTDIFEPIFQVSCNDATCHGHQTAARGKLWLGPPNGEVADEMLQTIVDNMLTPSATAPEMPNVVPGDPSRSFLMLKVDGCQDSAGLTCTAQDGALCQTACGDSMPQFDDPGAELDFPLPAEQANKIRAWIAQGAQNN